VKPAIEVDQLCKEYRIGDLQSFDTLRDRLSHAAGALIGRGKTATTESAPRIHRALDSVSFSVEPGEVLGIIGRNGAGKSTLLKILSRVTRPTSGRAVFRGRLAPLLEVGTGFNTELTGRENVYVNGTLLGMSSKEIDTKFDDIVEYAGVHKYIDTPVKRYSSGMFLRLGFAIAAHLEPDILIVDEVLAVGDAAFQRKCLGKMNQVAQQGRTVLFVSHALASIKSLCHRALWLEDGRVVRIGPAGDVVTAYLQSTFDRSATSAAWPPLERRRGNGLFHFTNLRIVGEDGRPADPVLTGQTVNFELEYETEDQGRDNAHVQIWMINGEGQYVGQFGTVLASVELPALDTHGTVVCRVPNFPFAPGTYSLLVSAELGNVKADEIENAATFDVASGDFFPNGRLASPQIPFLCTHEWTHVGTAAAATVLPTEQRT
jgi:lipopolysaccharide transport system ATP-binding protein